MPIKSKAQRRKFAELLVNGKISEEVYEEWNRSAGKKILPERLHPKVEAKKGPKRKAKKTSPTRRTKATPRKRAASARKKTTRKKAATRRPATRKGASPRR